MAEGITGKMKRELAELEKTHEVKLVSLWGRNVGEYEPSKLDGWTINRGKRVGDLFVATKPKKKVKKEKENKKS